MSTVAANLFHTLDGSDPASKPSTPASPTHSFQNQQTLPLAFTAPVRGQTFPPTPPIPSSVPALEPPSGVAWSNFIQTWQDEHVARWLTECKCGGHAEAFKNHDIRGDILLELDHPTLQEMGLVSVGDRFRILGAVKQLRHKVTSNVAVPRDTPNAGPSEKADTTTGRRRLESGRPAPLLLSNSSRNDLPRLVREQPPDSGRTIPANQPSRPLPLPTQGNVSNGGTQSSSSAPRTNLPPMPPLPRGQPPQAPTGRPPVRIFAGSGRRTPTQSDNVPAYVTQALPPAPNPGLLTPSSATSNWTGYHLPADPRPGNPGGGKTPQSNTRATSPLPRNAPRGTSSGHGRTGSSGTASPVAASPSTKPQRGAHPYATTQAVVPPSKIDLSPIAEGFTGASPASPPIPYTVGRGPFNPGTPSHSAATSLDILRRKLVKIALPDEDLTYTIDVDNCAGGVEVLEKVLRKFGKGSIRNPESGGDNVHTEDGGLSVDGWGAYMEDGTGPLDEAALLSYCCAPENPSLARPLHVRKIAKARRDGNNYISGLQAGPRPQAGQSNSKAYKRASSVSVLSGLGVRDPEKALEPPSPTQSAHGSHDSDSGRSSPATGNSGKRPSKLRNFFGQRPPSELITTHLAEYFPFTEKKVLERTARQSMMRTNRLSLNTRDSIVSFKPPVSSRFSTSTAGSGPRTSFSRTSLSSTAAPPLREKTPSPAAGARANQSDIPRVSLSTEDGRSIHLNDESSDGHGAGRSHPQLLPPIPFPSESLSESLESLTSPGGHTRRVSRALSTTSRASRRMSYMTELRSRRDRSDTASLMTVDEITAEVENRRRQTGLEDRGSDTDEWTEVGHAEDQDVHAPRKVVEAPQNLSDEEEEEEMDEEEEEEEEEYEDDDLESEIEDVDETTLNEDDVEAPLVGVATRKANKWIKGALIGAGSFGKVYLGMDASSGLLMAVKQVELPSGSAPNEERKQSMLSALEHEIELLQDLQHDNIVQYLYSSLEDDCLNIFLEYVPGGSVTALLRNYGAFEEPLVKNFVRQILQGLGYLHERGIIHRDIKGGNILVDNKGGVKISDFGISKKVDVQVLAGNRVHRPSLQGSVFWMAPEVVKQSGHTQKADIWSVGCLVVEMLTGEHPWATLTQMQAIFKIGSSARPEIPSDITANAQEFLLRTFDLDQEARPAAFALLDHAWISTSKRM